MVSLQDQDWVIREILGRSDWMPDKPVSLTQRILWGMVHVGSAPKQRLSLSVSGQRTSTFGNNGDLETPTASTSSS